MNRVVALSADQRNELFALTAAKGSVLGFKYLSKGRGFVSTVGNHLRRSA